MSTDNSTNERSSRAATLYRSSDNKQENSIDRQRDSVIPYAGRKSYNIVEEYVFEGIPGDAIGKHPRWQKFLRDAESGLFDVLVCDEWSRLSRQETLDFLALVARPLRDAGVTLDTVSEGIQRWDDLASIILTTVRADKSQSESITRSYRVLTGMAKLARLGHILGPAPYGYKTEYETIQEPGKPPKIIPVRFVPDPRRSHVVRWIFEKYTEGGWTMEALARELNQRAVEPPASKGGRPSKTRKRGEPCQHWTVNSVRAILKNPRYTGALTWNCRSRGKYHQLRSGQAEAVTKPSERSNDCEEWIVSAEAIPEPLVSQETFDRAQARRRANKGHKPSIGDYLFSSLVTCSHCGRTLGGIRWKDKRVYRCHRYDPSGNVVCGYHAVREDWLLDKVLQVLEQEMLAPQRLAALREEIRRQDEEERAPVALDPLRKRLAELEGKIVQGNENLAILPPDRVPGVVAVLRNWEQERDQVKAELQRREGVGNLAGLNDAVAACEAILWRLREAKDADDPLLLREVLRAAVARIELTWETRPYGKRNRYLITGGVIHLRPQLGEECLTLHGKPWIITTSGPLPLVT
jgi:DNA invertase Pin-like site-specific DNA recombinase